MKKKTRNFILGMTLAMLVSLPAFARMTEYELRCGWARYGGTALIYYGCCTVNTSTGGVSDCTFLHWP